MLHLISIWNSNNFTLKETENLYPKNIYTVSKKLNEEIADLHTKLIVQNFRIKITVLVMGQIDMFMLKLFKTL